MIGRLAQRFATAVERPLVAYGACVGLVAAAVAFRLVLLALLPTIPPFMTFWPAIMLATLVAGARGGLLALALSGLVVWGLFGDGVPAAEYLVFGFLALITVGVIKAMRVAVRRGIAAEERFRIAQEAAGDGFAILEPVREAGEVVDFRWAYANPAANRSAPAGVPTLAGRRVLEVFPDQTGEAMVERFKGVLAQDGPDDREVRRVIDGSERWMRTTGVRLHDSVAITFHDITGQRAAAEALREAEALARRSRDEFEHIANAAPVMIWMGGTDSRAAWFNASWLTFTGRNLAEELERGWIEGVHPDDRERLLAAYQDHFERREPLRIQYRLRRADGAHRWIDEVGAPRFDADGTFLGYIGACTDIHEQREADRTRRRGEAMVRSLVESLPQLLWSNRPDGHCDYLSPQWVRFTGVPAEQHMGEGWLDAVHPDDRDDVRSAWAQAVAGALPYDVEYRIRRHDGVWRWFNGRAAALRDDTGEVRRWFGTSSDITEIVEARRDLEERVAERTRELELSLEERARTEAQLAQAQRLETVGRLTGGVAHDFNNLLTVVIGGLDMILSRPTDTARVKRLAEAALSAGRRGERLTRQLLAFSRRQELKLEVVGVADLIEQVEPLIRRAVGEAVELTVTVDAQVGASRLDPAQFEAALLNLVVNASDAVDGSGAIAIDARRVTLAAGEVAGAAAGDYVRVAVADTGSGMSPEVLDRVFEPFFTTKEVGKGTGLGLAQVYGFVSQSGGAVDIRSKEGDGATVTLYIPAAAAEGLPAPAAAGPDRPAEPWRTGARVLLVEDDAAVRAVTEGLLAELGCEVTGEPDGPSALRRLEAGERFDILVTDIVMPGGMTGVDLARAAQARDPALPIVLTTGYAGRQAASDIAWPVLRKPFRADQLAAILRKALGKTPEPAA